MNKHTQKWSTYIDFGWQLLPVWWIEDGRCACRNLDCHSPGKHPIGNLVPRGLKDASNDYETVASWFDRFPKANIAVRTGIASNLLVIDVDPRNGGDTSIEKFPWRDTETIEAETGGGGWHLFYTYPKHLDVRGGRPLCAGVDIKGNDGYVLLADSNHISGGVYGWSAGPGDAELADPPAWLLNALPTIERALPETMPAGQIVSKKFGGENDEFGGGRNQALFTLATNVRKYGTGEANIYQLLAMENEDRCVPPVPDGQLRHIARMVAKYEPIDPALEHPDYVLSTYMKANKAVPTDFCDSFLEFIGEEEPGPEKDEFWIHGVIPKQSPFIIGGPPKAGKTWAGLDLAVALATGEDWMAQSTPNACKVMMLALEDNKRSIQRRMWHLLRGRNCPHKALENRLVVDTEIPFRFDDSGSLARLEAFMVQFRPDVLILDSLARVFGGDENSKEAIAKATIPWRMLCQKYSCAVGVIHHFKKSVEDAPALWQMLRGSGDLGAFCRHLIGIIPVADNVNEIRVEGNYQLRPPAKLGYRIESGHTPDFKEWTSLSMVTDIRKAKDGADLAQILSSMPDGELIPTSELVEQTSLSSKAITRLLKNCDQVEMSGEKKGRKWRKVIF